MARAARIKIGHAASFFRKGLIVVVLRPLTLLKFRIELEL